MTGTSGHRRFWSSYALHTFAAAGLIATALQVYDIFWPGQVTSNRGLRRGWHRRTGNRFRHMEGLAEPIQVYPLSNTEIRIVEGDLFEQSTNLVIGMCTTFDTEVPHIISDRSVQGQLIKFRLAVMCPAFRRGFGGRTGRGDADRAYREGGQERLLPTWHRRVDSTSSPPFLLSGVHGDERAQ